MLIFLSTDLRLYKKSRYLRYLKNVSAGDIIYTAFNICGGFMKKKYRIFTAAAAVVAVVAVITAALLMNPKKHEIKIIVATDTHYLSPRINDKGAVFTNMVNNSDGKLVQYCEEIFSAFSGEVIKSKPDVLILSGDLTLSGEKASHEDFAEKLQKIQDSGVQVLTIPGNHDISSEYAYAFFGDEYEKTENITAEEYRKLYYNFGIKQAESVDENSFSYLYKVNDGLYIMMIDTNAFGRGFVQEESLRWIEECLSKAQKSGAEVITVTHQNVLAHNKLLSFGYQLYNYQSLLDLLNEYGVRCNLSGHIHMQHIAAEGGFTEIVTSSLLVAPVQYGVITYNGSIDYRTKAVDVSAWEKNNNAKDENLLDFESYADEFFKSSGYKKSLLQLSASEAPEQEKKLIARAFADINAGYFSGRVYDISQYEEGISLCREQGGFLSRYIDTLVEEAPIDNTSVIIE